MWTMHEDGSVTLKLTIYLFRDSAVARMDFLQLLADSCIIFSLTGIFFLPAHWLLYSYTTI